MASPHGTVPVRQVISAYGNGGFRISGVLFKGPVLVQPTLTVALDALNLDDLGIVVDILTRHTPTIELLLVGCGARIHPLGPATRKLFGDQRIGLDVLDTGAACRTYNVLSAEGRRAGALLVPIL